MKILMAVLFSLSIFTAGCGNDNTKKDEGHEHGGGACCHDDANCPPDDCPCCEGECACGDDCPMCDCGDAATRCDEGCACDEGGECTCGPDCGCCGDGHEGHEMGAAAPVSPFSLRWMNAEGTPMFNSDDYMTSVFVIENYFLNCPYCNNNAPAVNELATAVANDFRIKVLDVGIDRNDSQYATWISRHQPNHPVLNDGSRVLSGQLGTSGYPTTYILDCRLNVVYKKSGEWERGDKETIEAKAREVAEAPCF